MIKKGYVYDRELSTGNFQYPGNCFYNRTIAATFKLAVFIKYKCMMFE